MKCLKCNTEFQGNFCPNCGYRVSSQQQNGDTVEFKPNAYSDKNSNVVVNNYYNQPTTSNKSFVATLILCVLLGVFGIHRFYVGKIGTGIIYLLTGGLFGIGWIIDIILIATGSFNDKAGNAIKSD